MRVHDFFKNHWCSWAFHFSMSLNRPCSIYKNEWRLHESARFFQKSLMFMSLSFFNESRQTLLHLQKWVEVVWECTTFSKIIDVHEPFIFQWVSIDPIPFTKMNGGCMRVHNFFKNHWCSWAFHFSMSLEQTLSNLQKWTEVAWFYKTIGAQQVQVRPSLYTGVFEKYTVPTIQTLQF